MNYIITLLLSVLCIFVLTKIDSKVSLAIVLLITMLYGIFVFPNINGICDAIKMSLAGQNVAVFSFVEVSVEKDWDNPKYWDYLFNKVRVAYWWLVWPTYFFVMYLVARSIGGSGNA